MHSYSRLALSLLLAPCLVRAQAPSFSQRFQAGRPGVESLMSALEFRQALGQAQSLLPESKPVFDSSSIQTVHTSCWNFIEAAQAYSLASRAAASAGQWEQGMAFLGKALEILKENRAAALAPLTGQLTYWQQKAADAKILLDSNADAITALRAKAKIEDYEKESLERIASWEKQLAEGSRNAAFFKRDLEMSGRDIDYDEKLLAIMDSRIKSQQGELDSYKPHPGDRKRWVEAVLSSHAYLDSIPERADKIELLCRLAVLAPDNRKVEHELDILMGKAAPDKKTPAKIKKA